jgi:hypothetical protein
MQYHKITRVFSMIINANPRLNIWDRITIISNINDYVIDNECRIKELENQIKNILNELALLKNTNTNKIKNKHTNTNTRKFD